MSRIQTKKKNTLTLSIDIDTTGVNWRDDFDRLVKGLRAAGFEAQLKGILKKFEDRVTVSGGTE